MRPERNEQRVVAIVLNRQEAEFREPVHWEDVDAPAMIGRDVEAACGIGGDDRGAGNFQGVGKRGCRVLGKRDGDAGTGERGTRLGIHDDA